MNPTVLAFLGVGLLIWLAVMAILIVAGWIILEKAGQPGWGVLIPFYNLYLAVKVATLSFWWFILVFVPLVNIVPAFVIPIAVARNFGKGPLFGIGMYFLPFIFMPILAFGDSHYDPRPMFD